MTGGADIQPVTIRAAGPVPSRVALASEQFSGLIDFLLPHARRDYSGLDTATLARYLDAFHATDTLADAWVTYLREHRGAGRRQVNQALESGTGSLTGPPPELSAFMRSVNQLPAVIDLARVEEGARCLRRIGAITITGFGMAAGFYLGAILPGSARALAASTRTVQDPARRLSETARFVLGTFAPGGYSRFGDGCKNATRLRLTHAAIRARLYHRDNWDTTIFGAPLSQADTLMAATTFNVIPALAAARLGYLPARRARRPAHRHPRPAAGFHPLHAPNRPRQPRSAIHPHRDATAGDREVSRPARAGPAAGPHYLARLRQAFLRRRALRPHRDTRHHCQAPHPARPPRDLPPRTSPHAKPCRPGTRRQGGKLQVELPHAPHRPTHDRARRHPFRCLLRRPRQ